jgi:hypothetical protein
VRLGRVLLRHESEDLGQPLLVFLHRLAEHGREPLVVLRPRRSPNRRRDPLIDRVMAPVLEACDRNRVPAYLEATSERNKQLYLRHGFDVTDEIPLPDGPMMWPMWRSPC